MHLYENINRIDSEFFEFYIFCFNFLAVFEILKFRTFKITMAISEIAAISRVDPEDSIFSQQQRRENLENIPWWQKYVFD